MLRFCIKYYPKDLDGDVRGPSSNPLGDSDFDSWINSSFFDDDGDDDTDVKGPKTGGHPSATTVTNAKPTPTKAPGIDFDAPLAQGDNEDDESSTPTAAATTTEATTTASKPDTVHETNVAEETEGGWRPTQTGGHHKGEQAHG